MCFCKRCEGDDVKRFWDLCLGLRVFTTLDLPLTDSSLVSS
jgi:hypothetical protein